MAEESVDKELNIRGLKGINTALPDGEPDKNPIKESAKSKITSTDEFILPDSPKEDVLSAITKSTLSSDRTDRIRGSNLSYDKETSDSIDELYTPFDLSTAIPDPNEREEYIRQHGSKMVELLKGGKKTYGITFADQIKDYYGFRKNGYDTQLKKFVDNLDAEQGNVEAFFTGMGKWASKTLNSVTSLIPLVYGIGSALVNRDATKLFDNTLFDQWEKNDQWIDSRMVVYGGYDYHQLDENGKPKGFFARLTSNPMKSLADDVAPMAAFVSGAILTEIAAAALAVPTGGAAVVTNTARLAAQGTRLFSKGVRTVRGLDALSDMDKMRKLVIGTQSWKKGIGLATSMVRTAGYESALIARGTQVQTKNRAIYNYMASEKQPGLKRKYDKLIAENSDEFGNLLVAEQEILDQIEQDLPSAVRTRMQNNADNASELAWTLNIPLVGISNMLQFPKIFNSSYRIGQGVIARRLAKINPLVGTKMVGGEMVSRAANRRFLTKAYGYISPALVRGFTEAGEEFSQGVIEEGFSDYWSAEFNPKSAEASMNFLQSISNSAKKYYKSVEGEDSMLMGFLMGISGMVLPVKMNTDTKTGKQKLGLGIGTYGGVFESYQEINAEIKKAEAQSNLYNTITTNDVLKNNLENALKGMTIQSELDEALEKGNLFEYKNKEFDNLFSFVKNRLDNGIADTIFQDLDALEEMSLADFNETYAYKDQEFQYTAEQQEKIIETARKSATSVIESVEETEAFFNDERVFVDKLFNNELVQKVISGDRFLLNKYLGKQNIDEVLEDFSDELYFEDGTPIKLTEEQEFEVKESQRRILKSQFSFLNAASKNLNKREAELKDSLKKILPNGGLSSLIDDAGYIEFITGIETKTLKNVKGEDIDLTRITFADSREKSNFVAKQIIADIKQNNSEAYKFNGKKIDKLVKDIFNIKQRKAKTASMYETLFTKKGATRFLTLKNNLRIEYSKNLLKVVEEQAKARIDDAKSSTTIEDQENQADELNSLGSSVGNNIKAHLEEKQIENLRALQITLNNLVKDIPSINISKYTDAFNAYYDIPAEELVKLLEPYPAVFQLIKNKLGNKTPGLQDWDSIPAMKIHEKSILKNDKANTIEELIRNTFLDILKDFNTKVSSNNSSIKNENSEDNNINTVNPPEKIITKKDEDAAIANLLSETDNSYEKGGAVLEEFIIPPTHDNEFEILPEATDGTPYTGAKGQVAKTKWIDDAFRKVFKYFPVLDNTGKFVKKGGTDNGQNKSYLNKNQNEEFNIDKINDAEFLTNEFLEKNASYVKFKFTANKFGDKSEFTAQQIGINIYYSQPGGTDIFMGQLPATVDTDGKMMTKFLDGKGTIPDRQIPSFIKLREELYNAPVDDKGFLIKETTSNTIDNYVGYEATVAPKTETKETTTSLEATQQISEVEVEKMRKKYGSDVVDNKKLGVSSIEHDELSIELGRTKEQERDYEEYDDSAYQYDQEEYEDYEIDFDERKAKYDAELAALEQETTTPLVNPKVIISGTADGYQTLSSSNTTEEESKSVEDPRGDKTFGKDGFRITKLEDGSSRVTYKSKVKSFIDKGGRPGSAYATVIVPEGGPINKQQIQEAFDNKLSEIIESNRVSRKGNKLSDLTPKQNQELSDAVVEALQEQTTAEREMSEAEEMYVGIQDIMMELEPGTKEWNDAVNEMAELEDIIVKEFEEKGLPSPRPTTQKGVKIRKETSKKDFAAAKKEYEKIKKAAEDRVDKQEDVAAYGGKDTIAEMFQYQLIMMRNYSTNLLKEMVARKKAKIEKYSTSTEKRFKTLLPYLKSELKAIENIIEEGVTPREATALEKQTSEVESKRQFQNKVYIKAYDNLRNKPESELKSIVEASKKSARSGGQSSPISVAESFIARKILDGKTKELDVQFAKPTQQTTSPETEVEQSAREKVIENNFQEIIKQLENNQIIDGENFVGQERDCK